VIGWGFNTRVNNNWDDSQKLDPAEQAGLMLFRIGFGIMFIVVPLTASLSRRAPVIIAPIGAVIMLAAAFMTRNGTNAVQKARTLLWSPLSIITGMLFVWALLSLLWTPWLDNASERLFRTSSTAFLTFATVMLLPERMKTSNLYLIAIGVCLSIITTLILHFSPPVRVDSVALDRNMIILTLLGWPAVTYLALKKRSFESMVVAGAIGTLLLGLRGPSLLPALLVGAIILGGAVNNTRAAALALIAGIMVTILAAPLWAFTLSHMPTQSGGLSGLLQIWAELIAKDPLRLLTGHGLDTALRNKISPALEISTPKSLLFEIWYELGLIGAVCLSAFLIMSVESISRLNDRVAPYALGAFGFAFSLSIMGLGTSQTWWLTTLSMTIIAFAAIIHRENAVMRPVAIMATSEQSSFKTE
jgi:hypothetical protein